MTNLGEAIERKAVIETNVKCIKALMETTGFTINQAMDALKTREIDRDMYRKMVESRV